MLKFSELGLGYGDFSKQSLNTASNCTERCWGILLSNGFPLYLPHVTGVENEVSCSSSSVFDSPILQRELEYQRPVRVATKAKDDLPT